MLEKRTRKKAPLPTDRYIGSRIRMRRRTLNISQEWLGNATGVTFQQIQKYENGTNRVGAGRLQQIADALQCEVAWFFEGSGPSTADRSANARLIDAELSAFYAERYAPDVVHHFPRLTPPVKRALAMVIAAIAERTGES